MSPGFCGWRDAAGSVWLWRVRTEVWGHRRFALFWTGDTLSALGSAPSVAAVPVAPFASVLPGFETRDVVGRDADLMRTWYGQQVGLGLRVPAGGSDGFLVWEHVSNTIAVLVQCRVLLAAKAVDPPEVRRRVGFHQFAKEANFLGVAVEACLRPSTHDLQPTIEVSPREEVAGVMILMIRLMSLLGRDE